MVNSAQIFERPGQGRSQHHPTGVGYLRTRNRVETYFDSTATKTWERLTSDAPVSGIRLRISRTARS